MINHSEEELKKEYCKQILPLSGPIRSFRKALKNEPSIISHLYHFDQSFLLSLYMVYQGFSLALFAALSARFFIKGLESIIH